MLNEYNHISMSSPQNHAIIVPKLLVFCLKSKEVKVRVTLTAHTVIKINDIYTGKCGIYNSPENANAITINMSKRG